MTEGEGPQEGERDGRGKIVDLAAYGIVNAGKSSLLNALARRDALAVGPIGGTTRDVAVESWREATTEVGPYLVRLIDTPGLEEVGGEALGGLATEAARSADLIVFVTAEDLTATARSAIAALREWAKPLIVAVNKMDLLEPHEQAEVLKSIRENLSGLIPESDVIPVSAAPLVRRRIEDAEGRSRVETIRGEPEIRELEDRILNAIAASAPDLNALREAAEDVDRHVAAREVERVLRRTKAERAADETSVAMAMALAVNPIPLLDFLAGSGGLAILVRRVADAYGERLTPETIQKLAGELLRGGRVALWGSMAAVGLGGALKFLPGIGHVVGGIAQGVAAGFFGHVVGRALVSYFENGHDWGDGGLVAALDRIAASTDRRELTRGLVDRLKERLRGRNSR